MVEHLSEENNQLKLSIANNTTEAELIQQKDGLINQLQNENAILEQSRQQIMASFHSLQDKLTQAEQLITSIRNLNENLLAENKNLIKNNEDLAKQLNVDAETIGQLTESTVL
jgi:hypothetical protein